MGDSVTKTEYGNLFIQLDKAFFQPGETVKGKIQLILTKNYPGNSLYLKIIGFESTNWVESIQFNGIKQMFQHKFLVYKFEQNQIQQGQYSIPIQFNLPEYLPGSFSTINNGVKGIIEYRIQAEIESNDKNIPNLVYSQLITIRENVQEQQIKRELIINQKVFGFLNRGTCKMLVQFDKLVYGPNEIINVICEIDNSNCSADMADIQLILIHKMSFLDNSGHSKDFTSEILKFSEKGIKARQSALGSNQKVIQLKQDKFQDNLMELLPTTSGQIIVNQYFLKILTNNNGFGCCQQQLFVEIPLYIYATQHEIYNLQQPSNWNPKILNTTNLIITDQYLFENQQSKQNNRQQNMITQEQEQETTQKLTKTPETPLNSQVPQQSTTTIQEDEITVQYNLMPKHKKSPEPGNINIQCELPNSQIISKQNITQISIDSPKSQQNQQQDQGKSYTNDDQQLNQNVGVTQKTNLKQNEQDEDNIIKYNLMPKHKVQREPGFIQSEIPVQNLQSNDQQEVKQSQEILNNSNQQNQHLSTDSKIEAISTVNTHQSIEQNDDLIMIYNLMQKHKNDSKNIQNNNQIITPINEEPLKIEQNESEIIQFNIKPKTKKSVQINQQNDIPQLITQEKPINNEQPQAEIYQSQDDGNIVQYNLMPKSRNRKY